MNAPAAERPHLNQNPGANRADKAQAPGELCPMVAAMAAELGLRPSKARWLQRQYDRRILPHEHALIDGDDVEVLTVARGRSGSVPVDLEVGARVVRELLAGGER